MVLRVPWPPKGFLDHSGDPLPSHFLRASLVDLVSIVDGGDSAFGGVAGDDLGTELGRVPSMEEQDPSGRGFDVSLSEGGRGRGSLQK